MGRNTLVILMVESEFMLIPMVKTSRFHCNRVLGGLGAKLGLTLGHSQIRVSELRTILSEGVSNVVYTPIRDGEQAASLCGPECGALC